MESDSESFKASDLLASPQAGEIELPKPDSQDAGNVSSNDGNGLVTETPATSSEPDAGAETDDDDVQILNKPAPTKKPTTKKGTANTPAAGDDAPAVKKPRTRSAPKLGADGNPMPKPARKTPVKKAKQAIEDSAAGEGGSGIESEKPMATPKKRAAKPKLIKKAADPEVNEADEDVVEVGDEDILDPVTPGKAVKATPKTPKSTKRGAADHVGESPAAKKSKTSATPKKLAAAVVLGADGLPVLSELDALVFKLKEEGRSWADIVAAYKEAGGTPVGADGGINSLRKRFAKLAADRVSWTQDQDDVLMTVKQSFEANLQAQKDELSAALKALEGNKWADVVKAVNEQLSEKFTASQVTKRVEAIKDTWVPRSEREAAAKAQDDSANGDENEDGEGGADGDGDNAGAPAVLSAAAEAVVDGMVAAGEDA